LGCAPENHNIEQNNIEWGNKNKETFEVPTALKLRIHDFWVILSSTVINS
jgi:hypothetical protein